MPEGAAAAIIGSTVIKGFAELQAAKAESRAAQEQADARREQAVEILDRFEVNAEVLRQEGRTLVASQQAGFIKAGVSLEGTPLSVLEDTNNKINRQIMIERREAEFRSDQLRTAAGIDERVARDINKARILNIFGTAIGGAASFSRLRL